MFWPSLFNWRCTVRFCEISWLTVPIVSFQRGFIDPPTNRKWDNILLHSWESGHRTIHLTEYPLSTNVMFGYLYISLTFVEGHHHQRHQSLTITTYKECTRMTMEVLSTGHGTETVSLKSYTWTIYFGKIPSVLIVKTYLTFMFILCLFHMPLYIFSYWPYCRCWQTINADADYNY